jgi:hypothetical protein
MAFAHGSKSRSGSIRRNNSLSVSMIMLPMIADRTGHSPVIDRRPWRFWQKKDRPLRGGLEGGGECQGF